MPDTQKAPAWYLYIIKNRLNQLYTGVTTDPERRFREHCQSGQKCAKALKGKGPLTMQICVQLEDRSAALSAEIAVKRLSRSQKDRVISGVHSFDFDHRRIPLDSLSL